MTELQQDGQFPYDDEPVQQEVEQVETEQETNDLSDISPDSEPETEKNAEGAKKPNKLQERLDKQTAKIYAEKRRADELELRLKQLESQTQEVKPLPDDLAAPELPEDTWDTEAMRKYHQEMISYQRKLAEHAARSTLNSAETEKRKAEQQQAHGKIVQGFADRAIKNGITIEQLEIAGTGLVNAGLSQDLQMLIMEDEAGPLITMHLAKNPELAQEILSMPLTKAAIKLATQVKEAALSSKPRLSKAPDPIPSGKPASINERDDFDKKYKAQFI